MKFVKVINKDSKYYGYVLEVVSQYDHGYTLEIPKHIPEYREDFSELAFEFWEVEEVN